MTTIQVEGTAETQIHWSESGELHVEMEVRTKRMVCVFHSNLGSNEIETPDGKIDVQHAFAELLVILESARELQGELSMRAIANEPSYSAGATFSRPIDLPEAPK